MLHDAGMDLGAVFTATAISSMVATNQVIAAVAVFHILIADSDTPMKARLSQKYGFIVDLATYIYYL